MNKVITFIFLSILLLTMGCKNESKDKKATTAKTETVKKTSADYTKQGMQHALATKKVLGTNLKKAIQSKGILNALSFCNVNAYPLTDSMSTQLNAPIKRVSDRYRNPANKANEKELAYIQNAKKQLASGQKVKPLVHEMNGKMIGYYPIPTDGLCLNCHGTPNTQIQQKTLTKINQLYPADKAVGYQVGELRGIWVVEMKK